MCIRDSLYSSNEKSELIRENSQEIFSVLAAHQIALWEYDIITGKCSFSNDYFFTLGLKDADVYKRQCLYNGQAQSMATTDSVDYYETSRCT